MERRLAAILCADVVGYSRLMGRDEAGTRALLRAFAAEHALPLVGRHGGQVVKTMGDGWLVAFASVVAAVECGLAWQAAAKAPLRFRIGVHLGDVMVEDGDLFGDGVNVAARLEALAEPGGICLSEDAWRQVRQKLDLVAEDMGEQQLKNIALPMRVFRIAPTGGAVGVAEPPASERRYRLPKILLAPFRPLWAGGAEAEALAAGVTETLATALAHFEDFELIDPGGARALVAAHGAREAGRRLGATYVLEGTLQLAMGKARTGVQLIDATSGTRVWAETLDREAADVFALQDEITALVASTLGEAVGEEQARVIEGLPDEAHYYRAYLGLAYFLAGRHADGVAVLSAVEGTVGPSRIARAANLAALGRLDEARAEARLVAADPDFNFDRLIAGLQLASSADRERLVEALQAAGLG